MLLCTCCLRALSCIISTKHHLNGVPPASLDFPRIAGVRIQDSGSRAHHPVDILPVVHMQTSFSRQTVVDRRAGGPLLEGYPLGGGGTGQGLPLPGGRARGGGGDYNWSRCDPAPSCLSKLRGGGELGGGSGRGSGEGGVPAGGWGRSSQGSGGRRSSGEGGGGG